MEKFPLSFDNGSFFDRETKVWLLPSALTSMLQWAWE